MAALLVTFDAAVGESRGEGRIGIDRGAVDGEARLADQFPARGQRRLDLRLECLAGRSRDRFHGAH